MVCHLIHIFSPTNIGLSFNAYLLQVNTGLFFNSGSLILQEILCIPVNVSQIYY